MPAAIDHAANEWRSAYGDRCSSPAARTAGVQSFRRQTFRFRCRREDEPRVDSRRERGERRECRSGEGHRAKAPVLLPVVLHATVREDAPDVKHHAVAVDVGLLEREPFLRPEPRPRNDDRDGGVKLLRDRINVGGRLEEPNLPPFRLRVRRLTGNVLLGSGPRAPIRIDELELREWLYAPEKELTN
jgi:hypothetical protein